MIDRLFWMVLALLPAFCVTDLGAEQLPLRTCLDFDWKFTASDPTNASSTSFDDSRWRKLDVPHDWSIEGPFAEQNRAGSSGGYAPLGTGWYRRGIWLLQDAAGKRVSVEFEGVFAQADVWLNGHKVGHHDFGYLGFCCDLTPYLNLEKTNVLAVRAENSKPASPGTPGAAFIGMCGWKCATRFTLAIGALR